MQERLRRRHAGDRPHRLRWHLERPGELDDTLERTAIEDFVVDTTWAPPEQVATQILQRWVA